MKGEIDKDFYCSCGFEQMGNCEPSSCWGKRDGFCESCSACHRKWPTPEQFKEEYGEEPSDDMQVWVFMRRYYKIFWLDKNGNRVGKREDTVWMPFWYDVFKEGLRLNRFSIEANFVHYEPGPCVVSCTPWGCPPADWKPE